MIEEIFLIDTNTNKTDRETSFEKINIFPSTRAVVNNDSILELRSHFPTIQPNLKNKYGLRNHIFKSLKEGNLFDTFPLFFSLLFQESGSLLNYIDDSWGIHFFNKSEATDNFEIFSESLIDTYRNSLDSDDDHIFPNPVSIFDSNLLETQRFYQIDRVSYNQMDDSPIPIKLHTLKDYLATTGNLDTTDKFKEIKNLLSSLKTHLDRGSKVVFAYRRENSLEEAKFLFEESKLHNIEYMKYDLPYGLHYPSEKLFILSENDLFSNKTKKTKTKYKQSSQDLFADQISTLKTGDYVIHKEFGVGKYLGIENLDSGNQQNDFLVIEYSSGDKVYVPVYKLNLVQKHADYRGNISVSNLRTKKFDAAKERALKSVKKLAFDLVELQAKRSMQRGFAFSAPDHIYKEFELSFTFDETPDQSLAIEDVLNDMQSIKPMDRLVCGDVGFGKTEVAMRAAFKAVLDNKQVAILVPTTVLAFQHYNSFVKRFKKFAVNIELISRFKSPKESQEIFEKVSLGQVDILIGTHKILSQKIKYSDLGLLIIDEEQRFGVAHKEKIKLIKENIDCLTLTATPIPRTLQMSFLGIKDLSIIKTAPPSRQSIKSYVIKEDFNTIKNSIQNELKRSGQVFIVHNKVHDIDDYAAKIKKLVPEARVLSAHGQLAEKELEKRIKLFYEHKYDILVATTIIESGIDIPSANTMIIDRADTYGLSQLHQLRGRIGRSDKKAYAYFMIPTNRNLSEIASKRLQALQTYADIGAGFSLASSDLEIRGSGDILGAEQSGHIGTIGLELYLELLQEAISEIKGGTYQKRSNLEFQSYFNSFITNKFISDAGIRLKFYKKLSSSTSVNNIDEISSQIQDQYGLGNESYQNLINLLKTKVTLQAFPIKQIKIQKKSISIFFDQELLEQNTELQQKVVEFFMARPKVYKLNPNFSVVCKFKDQVSSESCLEFAKHIALQIDRC